MLCFSPPILLSLYHGEDQNDDDNAHVEMTTSHSDMNQYNSPITHFTPPAHHRHHHHQNIRVVPRRRHSDSPASSTSSLSQIPPQIVANNSHTQQLVGDDGEQVKADSMIMPPSPPPKVSVHATPPHGDGVKVKIDPPYTPYIGVTVDGSVKSQTTTVDDTHANSTRIAATRSPRTPARLTQANKRVKFRLGVQTLHQRSKSDSVANLFSEFANGMPRRPARANHQEYVHHVAQDGAMAPTTSTNALKNWASSFFRRPWPQTPASHVHGDVPHQKTHGQFKRRLSNSTFKKAVNIDHIVGDEGKREGFHNSHSGMQARSLSPPTPFEDIRDEIVSLSNTEMYLTATVPSASGGGGGGNHSNDNVDGEGNAKMSINSIKSESHNESSNDANDRFEQKMNDERSPLAEAFRIRKLDDSEIEGQFSTGESRNDSDEQQQRSQLSKLLKRTATNSPLGGLKSNVSGSYSRLRPFSPKSRTIIKVFIPQMLFRGISNHAQKDTNGLHRVSLLLSEKTTASDAIVMALRQYQRQTGSAVSINPSHYVIRAAENDGSIDMDIPSLEHNTRIQGLGYECFVLLGNNHAPSNQFSESTQATIDRILKKRDFNIEGELDISYLKNSDDDPSDSEAVSPRIEARSPKKKRMHLKQPLRTVQSRFWHLEDVHLTVYLPNSVHPTIVPVAPDVMLKHLGSLLMDRFDLDRHKFTIRFIFSDGHTAHLPDPIRNEMVKSLKATNIIIQAKHAENHKWHNNNFIKRSGGGKNRYSCDYGVSATEITSSEHFGSSDDNAEHFIVGLMPLTELTYREYRVVKINKYNMRQERILGIDSNKLYNKMPKGASSIFGITYKHKTTYPERAISSILQIHTDPSKPLNFDITFDDGETIFWEAKTQVEFQEILSTLRHLVRMHQQQQRRLNTQQKSRRRGWSLTQTQMSP